MTTSVLSQGTEISRKRPIWSDRFENRTGPIWQRMGHIFTIDERMNAVDAMTSSGALFEYVKQPTYTPHPETGVMIETGRATVWQSPARDGDEWRPLTVVDDRFEIVQPRDIANLLDADLGGFGSLTGRWPVDLVGLTPNNAGMFITLRASDYAVAGDQMQRYFIIQNGNDGGTALKIGVIHVRLACWNTLTAAMKSAFVAVRIPHRLNANRDLATYSRIIAQMEDAQASVGDALNRLAARKVVDAEAQRVIDAAIPLPPKPQAARAYEKLVATNALVGLDAADIARFAEASDRYDAKVQRALELRGETMVLYRSYNDTRTNGARGTAYAVYNAVAEMLDNRAGVGTTDKSADRTALDVLFGHRAIDRDRAFQTAYELATSAN